MANKNGSINFNSMTVPVIDQVAPMNLTIRSFEEDFTYLYRYESLPMEWLVENDKRINESETKKCTPSTSWLNCLQSDRSIKIASCSNSYTLNLSYGFNFENEYFKNQTIAPKKFSLKFDVYCNFNNFIKILKKFCIFFLI